jgi:hypothetical protein
MGLVSRVGPGKPATLPHFKAVPQLMWPFLAFIRGGFFLKEKATQPQWLQDTVTAEPL